MQMESIVFFFKAEDGIRDIGVTGVQTCALPICHRSLRGLRGLHKDLSGEGDPPRPEGLRLTPHGHRGPLHGLRRVRRGLPGRGVRRGSQDGGRVRRAHPIEKESYRILRELVDLSHLEPVSRAVAERVIHASADLEYADTLVLNEGVLRGGLEALLRGAPIVADVGMVAAGITAREVLCFVSVPRSRELSEGLDITRSAAGVRVAAEEVGAGAVWVEIGRAHV